MQAAAVGRVELTCGWIGKSKAINDGCCEIIKRVNLLFNGQPPSVFVTIPEDLPEKGEQRLEFSSRYITSNAESVGETPAALKLSVDQLRKLSLEIIVSKNNVERTVPLCVITPELLEHDHSYNLYLISINLNVRASVIKREPVTDEQHEHNINQTAGLMFGLTGFIFPSMSQMFTSNLSPKESLLLKRNLQVTDLGLKAIVVELRKLDRHFLHALCTRVNSAKNGEEEICLKAIKCFELCRQTLGDTFYLNVARSFLRDSFEGKISNEIEVVIETTSRYFLYSCKKITQMQMPTP